MAAWNPFGGKRVPAEGPEEDLASVFNWTRNRRPLFHLAGFIFFSLIIHSAGFYLFQVVYPPPVRIEPEGEAVTVMDPGDPGVRALLKRVEDRTVFLFPPSSRSEVRMDVDDVAVRFSPAFRNMALEPVPPDYDWDLPPALKVALDPETFPDVSSRIEMSRSGSITDRPIAPWSIMRDYLERAEWLPDLTVSLKASREGSVTVTEVEGDLAGSDKEELKQVIESTLRFMPGDVASEGAIRIRSLVADPSKLPPASP